MRNRGRFLFSEGNTGRNILRADGMHNWDIGFMKNWYWAERYRVQFRAEMFNIFNHVLSTTDESLGHLAFLVNYNLRSSCSSSSRIRDDEF